MPDKRPHDPQPDPADAPKRRCHSRTVSGTDGAEPSTHAAMETEAASSPQPTSSTASLTIASPSSDKSSFTFPPRGEADQFDITAGSPRRPTIPLPSCDDLRAMDDPEPSTLPPWPLPPLPLLSMSALAIADDDEVMTNSTDSGSEERIWETASLLLMPRTRRRAMSAPLRPGVVWATRERGRVVAAGAEE
ncbi:hypothetical protein CC85DRAFT_300462 [Cutaneotrichosporon oleaginosum]|uniref:Uncharacterized protein n=1 Tax=Cutaneotrichosporon oleaginosum TaxID=879819 RepID=A0A0J0XTA5_9TREE|nr:uncharacterized protein CC85DRAFT_300462 [Cutaneotrichosporon oleaginosum]KLT44316.1 hypothetical protein CC85DRAFT_300462 [Cutaneotrichosporon oleaginosum]TXT07956.1 hypothetical protein COLE_04880 [Cutaneotrichosporon oleaginosum]